MCIRDRGEAIAKNLYEMSSLKVPVLSIVIGEGGSGGALALAVANDCLLYTSHGHVGKGDEEL